MSKIIRPGWLCDVGGTPNIWAEVRCLQSNLVECPSFNFWKSIVLTADQPLSTPIPEAAILTP